MAQTTPAAELPAELPGPADPADYIAAGEGPLHAPLWIDAPSPPLRVSGVLLHPATARAAAANAALVEGHRLAYASLYTLCREAPLAVAEAVPDPVVLRCPECPVAADGDLWRERLLVGGGGLLVGLVAGVLLALAVGG